jgi:hypothetical protein
MVVAGNAMKALFCTRVDDADHYSTDDGGGDEQRVEHVRSRFRHDNTDRSKMDTMTRTYHDGDHLSVVQSRLTVDSGSSRKAIVLRSGSSEACQDRSAAALADYYRWSQLALQLCSDAETLL